MGKAEIPRRTTASYVFTISPWYGSPARTRPTGVPCALKTRWTAFLEPVRDALSAIPMFLTIAAI